MEKCRDSVKLSAERMVCDNGDLVDIIATSSIYTRDHVSHPYRGWGWADHDEHDQVIRTRTYIRLFVAKITL